MITDDNAQPSQKKCNRSNARSIELRFALMFLLVFFVLHAGYTACQGTWIEHAVIDNATVRPSVVFIDWVSPEAQAQARGNRILSPLGSLSIVNGCEGLESLFLLWAAMIAFPSHWRRKLRGVLLGTLLIYLLNQARIITLFYALHEDRRWFDLLHGYIAPTFIIVAGGVFFLGWASHTLRQSDAVPG